MEALDLTAAELVLLGLAAIAGGAIQGALGFGYALVVVPALLLFAPEAVPVAPLTAVWIAGEVEPGPVRLGIALVPFTFLGLFAGRRFSTRLDAGMLRPAVLSFAAAAGAFALLRGLL